MRRLASATIGDQKAGEPLRIAVTTAGRENLVLRALVRLAIPMLRAPERYGRSERLQLAQTLRFAVGRDGRGDLHDGPPVPGDSDAPPDEELQDYEPGCQLEYDD